MSFKLIRFDLALKKFGLKLPKWCEKFLFHFLKLIQTDEMLFQAAQVSENASEQAGFVLKHLNITYDFNHGQLQPFIGQKNLVVCNHPTGFLEVFILMDLLKREGLDYRFLANEFVSLIPVAGQVVIPVDVYSNDKHTRIQSVRKIMTCFKEKLTLAAFPSGSVSRFSWKELKVKELPWNQNLLDMATRSGANIIHLHLQARNSLFFYVIAMLHPLLPTLFLFREYFKKRGKHFKITLEKVEEATSSSAP